MPRGMVIASDKEYKSGEEVYIAYSRYYLMPVVYTLYMYVCMYVCACSSSNNIQLLLQYGFVVPDNEHDYIILTMQEPKDEAIANQVEV